MEVDIINIFNSNKKISVKIVNLLDKSKLLNDKEKFFDSLLDDIKNDGEKNHVGGFLNENLLKNQLEREIFDKRIIKVSINTYKKLKIKDIKHLIKEVISHVKAFLNSKKILVYVFPTFSNFIIKKMNGCSGFLAYKNIIHIYLYPTKNWKTNFKCTLLHEFAHCIQPYYSYKMNLFDHLIAEGLAEHFQMAFTKKRNAIYYTSKDNKKMEASVLTFGIGLQRILFSIIDSNRNNKSINFPEEIRPFEYAIVLHKGEQELAERCYSFLKAKNKDVYIDDRDLNFKDKMDYADFLNVPYKIIIGKNSLNSKLEIKTSKDVTIYKTLEELI
ncbi:MAG: DUF2268 domain-containing putative Zn-dependent protease [Candidatus Pacearchaeota archaeon]